MFTTVQDRINEVRKIANDVEAHGRRWSVRLVGMPAPTPAPGKIRESTPEAKAAALRFFAEYLNVNNISPEDIDCAHRIGAVKDRKQTLLIRFFRREIAEHLLSNKKMLKGKTFAIFEDKPQLNMNLIFKVSKRAEVERAWNMGGSVWHYHV